MTVKVCCHFCRCVEEELQYDLTSEHSVSIVIVYHNEAVSVLIRMLNSILQRTPERYLLEIVLLDDFSDTGSTVFLTSKIRE